MSTIPGRDRQTLLVIDVQSDVVAGSWQRDSVVSSIGDLVERARRVGTPVIWVQHSDDYLKIGSDEWRIVSELAPKKSEPIVAKLFRSSFEGTNLEQVLRDLGATHLILCGAQSNYCVRHTLHAALERGYDVTLVSDAHTTVDEESESGTISAAAIVEEQNSSYAHYRLPGRKCVVTSTANIIF
ncbi:MAG TPA: cysteine hydrolase family protein [Candidatus Nanopelagicaceae bacterium]|nr:cysteine hydrolase family protein [Candidatus Nanopelagicaceae bacterium]